MSELKPPKLTPRLSMIASFVREDRRICDIGTDHAFLPVFLVLTEKSSSCIAADVNIGPLSRAKKTIERYGCQDKIKTILSDGFINISPDDFDDAVIAGMGGELIAAILENATFLKKGGRTLYLQPMTAISELRTYLYHNGWTITEEHLAKEGEKLYLVFEVKVGEDKNPLEPLFGSCLMRHMGSLERLYLDSLINKYEKILTGLSLSKEKTDTAQAVKDLNTLKEIKDRYDNSK